MGQFKPMVKMETTEPSVELKLKKGGHVSMKKKDEHGHKMMNGGMSGPMMARGMPPAMASATPMKPPMAMRRRAMTAMPTAMPTPMMKKGGEMESNKAHGMEEKRFAKLEAQLKKHENMPAHLAHKGMASGGSPAERMKNLAKARQALQKCKEGGGMHHLDKCEMHLAKCGGGSMKKMASGGATGEAIDKFETKTTINNDQKPYEKTMMHTSKKDKASGTGEVKEGNGGGYKKGGSINSETSSGDYNTTLVHQAKPDNANGTGGVRMSNAGGYKKGGKPKFAMGGDVNKYAVDNVVGTPKGKTNTTTGEVKESNAGGYKKGGALKKHFAMGGSVNNTGSAVAMPQGQKPASKPVHINQLSGTFKKGGKVMKFNGEEGSAVSKPPVNDLSKGAFDKTLQGVYNEDMDTAKYIRSIPSKIYQGAKNLMGMGSMSNADMDKIKNSTGSVTKSKESVTVTPAKKHGGSVKHC
jgi:hypothetical protein